MNIQWYPGHMTKTKRKMKEDISLVDIVIELLDARIPYSSKNPEIDSLAKDKYRIVVLNKSDLADANTTVTWRNYFEAKGYSTIAVNSLSGKGLNDIISVSRDIMTEKIERNKAKGRILTVIRAMIVGIPNVGKSTLINSCSGSATAKTGDRPGVTRAKQWIKIKKDFELMDTPGILWPKFEDKTVGLKLAFTGAINDKILETQVLATELIRTLNDINTGYLKSRYKIEFDTENPEEILCMIGTSRGFKLKGGVIDLERTAIILLDEYRGGKLGRLTLEKPDCIS